MALFHKNQERKLCPRINKGYHGARTLILNMQNQCPLIRVPCIFCAFHRTWKNTCQNIKRNYYFVEMTVILLSYFVQAFLLLRRAPLHTTKMVAYQRCNILMVCVYQKSSLTGTIKRLTLSLEVAYATLIHISSNP